MKPFFLTAALLFCMVCDAQDNPKNGYIITNNQDTIFGMIDYRTNEINSTQCYFKADDSQEYTLYKPNEIAGYRFTDNGQYYVSRNFNDEDWYFYEFIINGMLNLYCIQDGVDKIFYIEKEKTGQIVAYKEDILMYRGENDLQNKQTKQKAQNLFSIISESEQARKDLEIGSMTKSKLIKLVKDYHEEMNTSSEDYIEFQTNNSINKKKWKFSVSAGAGYGWWKEGDVLKYDLSGQSYTIGMCFEYDNIRWAKGQTIQYSLMFTHCTAQSKDNVLPDWHYDRTLKYNFNILAIGIGPKFIIGKENKPSFILRCGYMPSLIIAKSKTKMFDDFTSLKSLGAYAGVGVEIPMNKHALLINADYRCAYNSHYLLGTVGFRF